jgi:PhnB protein
VSLYLVVDDVDAVQARAIAAGATETMAVADQFDGDRRGTIVDPFGHIWLLATRTESIGYDELSARFARLTPSEGEN